MPAPVRYDLPLTTSSSAAVDAYLDGVDRLLSANLGADEAFPRTTRADADFALAHAARALTHQLAGRATEGREAATTLPPAPSSPFLAA